VFASVGSALVHQAAFLRPYLAGQRVANRSCLEGHPLTGTPSAQALGIMAKLPSAWPVPADAGTIMRALGDDKALCEHRTPSDGCTAFLHCVKQNEVESCKAILGAVEPFGRLKLIEEPDKNERTPLHHAAVRGNVRIVNFLLNQKADANCRDVNGCSPLHLCSNEAVAQLLIDGGTKPDGFNKAHQTPLEYMRHVGAENTQLLRLLEGAEEREAMNPPVAITHGLWSMVLLCAAVAGAVAYHLALHEEDGHEF